MSVIAESDPQPGSFLCGFEGGIRLFFLQLRDLQRLLCCLQLSTELSDASLRRIHVELIFWIRSTSSRASADLLRRLREDRQPAPRAFQQLRAAPSRPPPPLRDRRAST